MNRPLIHTKDTLNALDNPDEDAYQHITVFKQLGQ
jgi:ATP-dependent DNA helicase 2 subunit 2